MDDTRFTEEDLAALADLLGSSQVEVASLPEAELVAAVHRLHRVRASLDGALSAVVSVIDARTVWAADGARSPAGWLTARVDQSSTAAKAEVSLARALRSMPVVDAAARSGRLGRAKVQLLAAARAPEVVGVFAEHEAYLVDQVAGLRVDGARRFLAAWLEQARLHVGWTHPDPDPGVGGEGPRASLDLSPTFEGRVVLDGDLDAEHGAVLQAAVAAQVDAMFRHGVYSTDDGLAPAERRGLALMEIIGRRARRGTRHGAPIPSVEVIVDERTLAGAPVVDLDDFAARVCEILDGPPIAPATVRRFLCTGTAHRLVLSAEGEVLDCGMSVRLATRAQRRALRHRDAGCAYPGCTAPASWCDAHHIEAHDPVTGSGPTDMANLVLLCRFHHHAVHEGGHHLTRGPDGVIEVTRPDQRPPSTARPPRRPHHPDATVRLVRRRVEALRARTV